MAVIELTALAGVISFSAGSGATAGVTGAGATPVIVGCITGCIAFFCAIYKLCRTPELTKEMDDYLQNLQNTLKQDTVTEEEKDGLALQIYSIIIQSEAEAWFISETKTKNLLNKLIKKQDEIFNECKGNSTSEKLFSAEEIYKALKKIETQSLTQKLSHEEKLKKLRIIDDHILELLKEQCIELEEKNKNLTTEEKGKSEIIIEEILSILARKKQDNPSQEQESKLEQQINFFNKKRHNNQSRLNLKQNREIEQLKERIEQLDQKSQELDHGSKEIHDTLRQVYKELEETKAKLKEAEEKLKQTEVKLEQIDAQLPKNTITFPQAVKQVMAKTRSIENYDPAQPSQTSQETKTDSTLCNSILPSEEEDTTKQKTLQQFPKNTTRFKLPRLTFYRNTGQNYMK